MVDRYCVIGNPISHTKSPRIHMAFAAQTGWRIQYDAIEAPLGEFFATAETFRASGGLGMNITAPFKLDAYAYATELLPRAKLAGAVNAIKFENGQILADNFDGIGLLNDIQNNLRCRFCGLRVLLLGAGGAARGAIVPFLEAHPAELVILNRTAAKASALAAEFSAHGPVIAANDAGFSPQSTAAFDVVINATCASLRGELPPLPPGVLGTHTLAYELLYGKGLTPFLAAAKQAGVRQLADGAGMLVEQAAEAFLWWQGVRPETRPVIADLTVPIV